MAAESWAEITMTLTPLVTMLLTCWACLAESAAAFAYSSLQSEQRALTLASKYGLSNFSYRAVTLSGSSRPMDLLPELLLLPESLSLSSPALPHAAIESAMDTAVAPITTLRIVAFIEMCLPDRAATLRPRWLEVNSATRATSRSKYLTRWQRRHSFSK